MSRFLFALLACASASWTPELKLKKHGDQSKVSQEWGPAIRATLKASLHAYADKAISSPKAAAKLLAKTAERLDAVVAVLDNRVFLVVYKRRGYGSCGVLAPRRGVAAAAHGAKRKGDDWEVHKSLLCATCTLRFVQLALRSFAAHFGFQKVLDGADGRRAFLRDGLKSWRGTLLEVKFGDALTLAATYQHESYTMVRAGRRRDSPFVRAVAGDALAPTTAWRLHNWRPDQPSSTSTATRARGATSNHG
ncbi:hypothetical protein JL721_4327 [Aureococcus anophagefferens]|nr:hypothetical protein JL721_4327 [Aureococcus anophagefferens]